MASMHGTAELQQQRSISHMPRLQYRNAVSSESLDRGQRRPSIDTISTGTSTATAATSAASLSADESCPSPTIQSAPSGASGPMLRASQSSKFPQKAFSIASKSSKKKSGVFGFFSVKEPSQQAFLDYQENLRKHAAAKGGQPTSIGLPGVSATKLPSNVPKVNSRWDGVPQAAREKRMDPSKRRSIPSRSRPSSYGRSGTPPSRASSSSGSSVGYRKQYTPSTTSHQTHNTSESGASVSILIGTPSVSTFQNASKSSLEPHQKTEKASSIISGPEDHMSRSMDEPSKFNIPSLSSTSTSPLTTPLESSPATPISPAPELNYSPWNRDAVTSGQLKDQMLLFPSPSEEVTLFSSGLGVLKPPVSANVRDRSTQRTRTSEVHAPAFLAGEAQEMKMPSDDDQPHSTVQRDSTPSSPPVTSYFPGNNTHVPSDSSRGRLGVAMAIRNRTSAPWHSPGSIKEPQECEQASVPTHAKGKKRISLFGL